MFPGGDPPREVLEYYELVPEEHRLGTGPFQLEFERTKELLSRLLPSSPARVLDVGGAAGPRNRGLDPAFVRIRDRDLQDGQHRNDTGRPDYFTTAYFHRPEDLCRELEDAGLRDVRVLGVEGPGWMIADFDSKWADQTQRADVMAIARALESEPSILGVSAHLLGVGNNAG